MIDLKLVREYTKNLHVLYVEDNTQLRESTIHVLNNFFQEVHVAVDGVDGLEKYKTYQASTEKFYDLVISDINMPHKNGVEMSEDILKIEPIQSIIFVTAHNEVEFLHQAITLGISSFLLKPLNLQDLATVLFKVCRSLSDRVLVEEHYAMMEEMNQQLENQNHALEAKNKEQQKLIRLLETMEVKAKKKVETKAPIETVDSEKKSVYYEQMEQLIHEDLSELTELHDALDAEIIAIIGGDNALIPQVQSGFSRYASILGMYTSFDALSISMVDFTKAISQAPLPKDSSKTAEIFMFLEAFMYILGKWQKDLLNQSDEKVDQLDVSIIGDMETITNMWLAEEETQENSVVEFF